MRRTPLKRKGFGTYKETRGSKYGNRKTSVAGKVCDSKLEADRYQELLLLQKAKQISDLELHKEFRLELPHQKTGLPHLICKYEADFAYKDKFGKIVVEDTKGVVSPLFKIKKELMLCIHGIDVRVLYRKDVGRLS